MFGAKTNCEWMDTDREPKTFFLVPFLPLLALFHTRTCVVVCFCCFYWAIVNALQCLFPFFSALFALFCVDRVESNSPGEKTASKNQSSEDLFVLRQGFESFFMYAVRSSGSCSVVLTSFITCIQLFFLLSKPFLWFFFSTFQAKNKTWNRQLSSGTAAVAKVT